MVVVESVLDADALGITPAVLSRPGLPVRWVATSELTDPSPFLEGGEILLTTGLSTLHWDTEWFDYVRRLVDARVVALGLATGLTHLQVPSRLVEACTQHRLNLFEVPRSTTFVAISRVTAHLLEEQEQRASRLAFRVQRQLAQAALRRDDGSSLLKRLAEYLHGAAGIMGANSVWLVPPIGPETSRLDREMIEQEIQRMRPQGLRASATISHSDTTIVLQPLGLHGAPDTYMAVSSMAQLDDGQRGAITTAVALLSVAVENRNDQRDTDRRLRRRAMELLLEGDGRLADIVLAAVAERGGTQPRVTETVRVIHATGTSQALDEVLAMLETSIRMAESSLAVRVADEIWVIAAAGKWRAVADVFRRFELRVGVGGSVPLDQAWRSQAGAKHALEQTTPESPVGLWEQLLDEGVLALLDKGTGAAFAEDFLGPLNDAPLARSDLVATLRSFLRHNGRLGSVAEELTVHRNTVRNRVAEIEGLLGRSLADPQVRVNAWIALQVSATQRVWR